MFLPLLSHATNRHVSPVNTYEVEREVTQHEELISNFHSRSEQVLASFHPYAIHGEAFLTCARSVVLRSISGLEA
jgi:hypothetical protein